MRAAAAIAPLLALALAQGTAGQSACSTPKLTAADIAAITDCTRIRELDVSGSGLVALALPNLKHAESITVALNPELKAISLPSLASVGSFSVRNNTLLRSAELPMLAEVENLAIETNPAWAQLELAVRGGAAGSVSLVDNAFRTVAGLGFASIRALSLQGMSDLGEIVFPELKEISGSVVVASNKATLDFKAPKLAKITGDATITTVGELDVPQLAEVTGNMDIRELSGSSLSMPSLAAIGQTLSINDNSALANVSFPHLATVSGTLNLRNNPQIASIDGFSALKHVEGSVEIELAESLTSVDFPKLEEVNGAVKVEGKAGLDCASLSAWKSGVYVRGQFSCSNDGSSSSSGEERGHGGSSRGSSSSSKDRAKSDDAGTAASGGDSVSSTMSVLFFSIVVAVFM